MRRKRTSFMLTSEPCSTKNLTISVEFILIAIPRGHSLIFREYQKTMKNMKRKIIPLNKNKYEKKEGKIHINIRTMFN